MFIYSTAFLLQSRCGRVAILCFRATETANLGNWLGDAEVGSDSSLLFGGECAPPVRVHAGFHLNVRATWWPLVEEPQRALRAGSLSLRGQDQHGQVGERLRAVYTYGQPMALCEPVPEWTGEVARKLVRQVIPPDPVPALPPLGWGPFAHIGQEFQYASEPWVRTEPSVMQAAGARHVVRSIIATLGPERRRESAPYLARAHLPQHYIAALRPRGRITELGDSPGGMAPGVDRSVVPGSADEASSP